jgi:hypothetical protein
MARWIDTLAPVGLVGRWLNTCGLDTLSTYGLTPVALVAGGSGDPVTLETGGLEIMVW